MIYAIVYLSFMVVLSLCFACSNATRADVRYPSVPVPYSLNQSACKSKGEISSLEVQLRNGSVPSFLSLMSHYSYCSYDLAAQRKILEIAVDSEISGAKRQLGTFIVYSSDTTGMTNDTCNKGIELLKAAVSENDKYAVQELSEAIDICSVLKYSEY